MKLIQYVIVIAALATSKQSVAATAQARHVDSTGDLVELCSVMSVDDPLYNAAMGFCLGVRVGQPAGAADLTHGSEQRIHGA